MSEINTLVYFDIEATGLKSSGKPRICEISLVAVNTQDVLNLGVTNKEDNTFSEATRKCGVNKRLKMSVLDVIFTYCSLVKYIPSFAMFQNFNRLYWTNLDKSGQVWTNLDKSG